VIATMCGNNLASAHKKVAFIVCSNVMGGHEFQTRALIDDFSQFCQVTVFLNNGVLQDAFDNSAFQLVIEPGLFLGPGRIHSHLIRAFTCGSKIRALLSDYDCVIICAGAIEAGVTTSIALRTRRNVSLYLPSICDRTKLWGAIGHLYNLMLAKFGKFYEDIIVINRIQARLIGRFVGRPTVIVPNLVADLPCAAQDREGRLVFIGRLDRQKRVGELIQWLDSPENPYQHVHIIGNGPERHHLESIANSCNYLRVAFDGWLSRDAQTSLIDGNDVLLLNSVVEGEPLVIREANRRGIIVLARDIDGVRGVTYPSNRFRSQSSLIALLKKSHAGSLLPKYEKLSEEVRDERIRATKKFLVKKY
jgi:glycosyltransferase involved in cell wall biosynthesis